VTRRIVYNEWSEERRYTYIQRLYPLVKPGLNALRHQAAPTPAAKVMLDTMFAETVFLHDVAVEAEAFEFDAVVLHVHVEIAVARADAAVALYDPGVEVFERGRERYRVADQLAVA
jgi:hypothetical protein